MKILICGAGIAGLTLARRLLELGHQPSMVEQTAALRGGGYMIDFFGSGFDAAEKMGLLGELAQIHYPIARLAFLDTRGRVRFVLSYPVVRKRMFDDRHFNFLRGDLEQVLFRGIERKVSVRFSTTIDAIEQDDAGVRVTLSDGSIEQCDLLIGADGVHSRVRRLVFGEEPAFSRFLGFHTAAFLLDHVDGELGDPEAFDTLTVPNRQVAIYPIRGGKLATFFVHRAANPCRHSAQDVIAELRRIYGDMRWIVPELLERASGVRDLYYDDIAQIEMPKWSSGRVALVGDACQCVSLLAGQGASMAMASAYVLAEELGASREAGEALARYERRLMPAIRRKQQAGRNMAAWFAPRTPFELFRRDWITRLSMLPGISAIVRRSLAGESIFD